MHTNLNMYIYDMYKYIHVLKYMHLYMHMYDCMLIYKFIYY